MQILDIYKKRRTQYVINDDLPLNNDQVEKLIREVVRETPSAFNSQSSRIVILFGEEHKKLWEIVRETLRAIVPADDFEPTDTKINGFAAGAGTVLFFEDQNVVKELQEKFALYADKFPVFSQNSAGMTQFAVWTALANKSIGASLQHYNPVIDKAVKKQWNLPDSWDLSAQMPFGAIVQPAGEKSYIEDEDRFRIFK